MSPFRTVAVERNPCPRSFSSSRLLVKKQQPIDAIRPSALFFILVSSRRRGCILRSYGVTQGVAKPCIYHPSSLSSHTCVRAASARLQPQSRDCHDLRPAVQPRSVLVPLLLPIPWSFTLSNPPDLRPIRPGIWAYQSCIIPFNLDAINALLHPHQHRN